jgi:type IV pilus assembly protein PilA
MENAGRYPADQMAGFVPPELASYLDATLDWTARTPIGGQWDWDFNVFSFKAAIVVHFPSADVEQLTEIDRQFDDGSLTTGRFRSTADNRYSCIIEN